MRMNLGFLKNPGFWVLSGVTPLLTATVVWGLSTTKAAKAAERERPITIELNNPDPTELARLRKLGAETAQQNCRYFERLVGSSLAECQAILGTATAKR